jgi:two-component system, NarL family, nitrate/nitrite response regulator NarL
MRTEPARKTVLSFAMPNILKGASVRPEIRILLVHGQTLMRETLGPLLRAADFQIVGSCASLSEASRTLEQESVHVVLIDSDLGLEPVLDFLTRAKAAGFKGQFLITAARLGIGTVLHVLERGALGVLMQHNAPSELVAAIQRLAKGELWLDSETVKRMVAAVRSGEHRVWQGFSVRECAVLKAVLEGLTNHEIAVKLQIPKSSVKYSLAKLFEKSGVRTRAQLVRIALERRAQDWL